MLDNFEHLLSQAQGEIRGEISSRESYGAEKFLAEILGSAPRVKILVSSRETLNLQEAWFHPVNGMHFPGEGVVEDQELIAIGSFNTLNPIGLLIEYGYIYESQFYNKK